MAVDYRPGARANWDERLPAQIEDQMERLSNGEWRLRDRPERLPHCCTLQAVRPD